MALLNANRIHAAGTTDLVYLDVGAIPNSKIGASAFVLTLDDGRENRWSVPFTQAVRKALAYVKANDEASVLITRSSSQKFFSNGLDIKALSSMNEEGAQNFAKEVMGAFADVLELPIPTICLIQGHAFGAGMMFALAHDYRIQLAGKGFMCANEIELDMPIPRAELDLFAHCMAPIDYFDTVLSAKRWDGAEAYRRGLVHATGKEREIQEYLVQLLNRVAPLGKNRVNMKRFKEDTKGYVVRGLRNYGSNRSKL